MSDYNRNRLGLFYFTIVGVMVKINPKVSTWIHSRFPKKGEELKIIDLYTVMKQCEQIPQNANQAKPSSFLKLLHP